MSRKKIPEVKDIGALYGILHEYAKGRPTDWDEIREETMRKFAEDYLHKMRRIDRDRAEDELESTGIRPPNDEVIAELIRQLGEQDYGVQARAERFLILLGAQAVDALLQATKSENSQIRWRAAYALSVIGDTRAYESIADIAVHAEEGSEEHYEAIRALGQLGDTRAIDLLIGILNKAEFGKSPGQWAAAALSELGEPALPALRKVTEAGLPEAQMLAERAIDSITERLIADSCSEERNNDIEKTPGDRSGADGRAMSLAETRLSIDKAAVGELCRKHHIRRLSLFGSVLGPDFREDSDVDVLVEFQPGRTPGFSFFAIQDELSDLLKRKVDLNTPGFLSRYFRDKVLAEAEVEYAEE